MVEKEHTVFFHRGGGAAMDDKTEEETSKENVKGKRLRLTPVGMGIQTTACQDAKRARHITPQNPLNVPPQVSEGAVKSFKRSTC